MQFTVTFGPSDIGALIQTLINMQGNAYHAPPEVVSVKFPTIDVTRIANETATPLAQPAPSTAAAGPSVIAPEVPQVSSAPQAPAITSTAPPAAPVVAAAPAALTPPAVDAKGLLWDHRIHASSKALNADGTWRAKRKVDDALVAQVEAELRKVNDPITHIMSFTSSPAMADPAAVFGMPPGSVVMVPNAVPQTMAELMPRVSNAVVAAKLAPTALGDACMQVGLANVIALNAAPQLVPQVFAVLQQACGDL